MVAGRDFSEELPTDAQVAYLINETTGMESELSLLSCQP